MHVFSFKIVCKNLLMIVFVWVDANEKNVEISIVDFYAYLVCWA